MDSHSHTASETANKLHPRNMATGNPGLCVGGIVSLEKILKCREHTNKECLGSHPKV